MPDIVVPVGDTTAPRYRYYTADLVTNTIIGELSLEDVNYERSLKNPGSFDGKITITNQTNALDLYNATMPGKTAIYAVRDGVCVWGGIIWGRTYDMVGRSLTFSASEFTSYLNHRMIWKAYSQTFTAQLTKDKTNSNKYVFVESVSKSLLEPPASGEKVRVSFLPSALRKYTGNYTIVDFDNDGAPSNPGQRSFYINMPKLPVPAEGSYPNVTITMKVDTYQYLRDLITNTLNDFEYIQFPNEEITPGIRVPITVTTKKLVTSDTTHGIATLTTSTPHSLVVGQRIEIANVDAMLDGLHKVSEIPSPSSFTYVLDNPVSKFDKVSPILLTNISTSNVTTQQTAVQYREVSQYLRENVTHLKRTAGVVTLQLNSQHRFSIGDKVVVIIEGKNPALQTENGKSVNSFNYEKYNNTVQITNITARTITFLDPVPSHSNTKYDRLLQSVENIEKNTVQLAAPKTLLKVYPVGSSHGYNVGEQIQIVGVDGYTEKWSNPIFDGYSEIYEVSPGDPYTIYYYKVVVDDRISDSTIYQDDTLVFLYFDITDPLFKAGDQLLVEGLNLDVSSNDISSFNGYHKIEEDSAPDPTHGGRYYIYFRMKWDTIAYTGAGSGGIASVNGKNWIAYEAAYSEIKYDTTLKEPDSTSSISEIQYTPAAGASDNKLTVKTTSRHNLVAGDYISVRYAKEEDITNFGTDYARVVSVVDLNTFIYTVPYKSDGKNPVPPKKAIENFVTKSGTVTRIKSSVGAPQPVQASFTESYSTNAGAGSTVTLFSIDHGLSKGDSVIIDVDDSKYSPLENNKDLVKITSVSQDTFSYQVDTEIPPTDTMEVRGFEFKTDTDGQKVITFDIVEKGTTRAARTNTITKIKPKWHKGASNDNYVTYTTSAATTAVVGDTVTVSGLQNVGTTSTSTTSKTANVIKINYLIGTKSNPITSNGKPLIGKLLFIRFDSNHGLDENTGFSDANPSKIQSTVRLSGFPAVQAVQTSSGVESRSLGTLLNNKEIAVKSVPNSTDIYIVLEAGTADFLVSGLSGPSGTVYNKTTVSTTLKNFEQFNRTGTVDYVSGSTFSVKYDFLSGKSGNGVSATDSIGTEYTLATTGTAKLSAVNISNISADSTIRIFGIVDFTSTVSGKILKYSKINGTYKVKKTGSNPSYNDGKSSTKIYVVNKLKTDDGKSTLELNDYPYGGFDATYTDAKYKALKDAKLERWQSTSGTAYISFDKISVNTYAVDSVARPSSTPEVATVRAANHGFEVGDYVEVNVLGKYSAAFNQGGIPRKITAVSNDGNEFSYSLNAPTKTSHYSVKDNVVTLYIANKSAHNFVGGDLISVSGVATGINGSNREITSTGPYTISFRITTADKAKTAKNGTIALTTATDFDTQNYMSQYRGYAVPGAYIKRTPTVFSRTFGEFPANAGIGTFDYSTNEYSGNDIQNTPITGSSLNTVASILDKYSNGITGFEYRVDCKLEYDAQGNKNFTKTFVLIPIYPNTMTEYLASLPGGKLAVGQWAPPAAFGADKVIFEYPGNITNVNMTESAQDSATRMFVSSSSNGSGAAEITYAAASDTTLLAAGWPLLDKKETVTYPQPNTAGNKNVDAYGNYDMETDFNTSAIRFLNESKPPQGDITISVNGSLTPVVGSYDPGDWCSIIVNDDFVKNRLNSPLEPRKDVIVRKIDAIKVQVPNNPAFPEMIDLTLVPDWQVDTIGK